MVNGTDHTFNQLIAAVKEAGALLLSLWPGRGGDTSKLSITKKGDGSLVSAADMRSNEILTQALRRLYPNDLVFSEEVAIDSAVVQAAHRVWIIDPLDGTASFLEGRDDFSILIGLSVKQSAAAGIMYLPARDQLLVAQRGGGAFRNGQRISVSTAEKARPKLVGTRRFSSKAPHLEAPMMDSGLALAKVASGELDGAIIRMTTHREWDIAAPIAIIEEAGGRVSDEQGREVPLGTGGIAFKYFVASNGRVHDEIRSIIPIE